MTRIDHVWVADKDGEERRYASTVPFSEHFRRVLKDSGYVVRCIGYPVEDPSIPVAASIFEPERNPRATT